MRLYLVQHGDALPEEVDPDRPLSEEGRGDVERLAAFLGERGLRVARVVHSGKTRARQTAELLAERICPGGEVEARAGLAPNDPVGPVADEASRWDHDAAVVGHLPFMGRLAARLLAGSEDGVALAFRPGTVVCLERTETGGWAVAWMLRPELLA